MIITRDDEFRAEMLKRIYDRQFGGERTGVHQSDLVYCINKAAMRRIIPLEHTDSEILIFSIGWSTQAWLTGVFKDEDTIEKDGILVTPDATWKDAPWELKATYASNAKELTDMPHWLRQIMAQCTVTGTLEARLSRFNLMGNWKWVYHPSKPETIAKIVEEFGPNWEDHPTLDAWHMEFTEQDLARNWEWLLWRKDMFERILETGQLEVNDIAIDIGHDWECGYCPKKYKELCDNYANIKELE